MPTSHSIGITAGDPGGIGAEVLLRALETTQDRREPWPSLKVFGDARHFERIARRFSLPPLKTYQDVELIDCPLVENVTFPLGQLTEAGAQAQVLYIETALKAVDSGEIQAIVTAPIHKQALAMCGLPYHGHTEWLADHAKTPVAMMLVGPILRTVPVTCHIPLSEVATSLRTEDIFEAICLTHQALSDWFGLSTPRIAVCGLNPHAGDDGLLGKEDEQIVKPAIIQAKERKMVVSGPFPGDTIFYFAYQKQYDAVIAMYHDQALAPLKLVHFDEAVNVTLGLPFVRTSVDHGTAYDIAASGVASSTSMEQALALAASILS